MERERGIVVKRAGVIGLGDMGSGLAKNLLGHGFETFGFDLNAERMAAFTEMGGQAAATASDVGRPADAVYVMVMNGEQATAIILGKDGLLHTMSPGSAIVLTATVGAKYARDIGAGWEGSGIHLIDAPVSGGYAGAQGGTLTIMAAASDKALAAQADVLNAVSSKIHHVGHEPGMGQTVKAVLQSLIGSIFTATFEAAVLGAKAGVSGEVMHRVISTSGAGCGVANNALEKIIDREFVGTGSAIGTMHKDLTISLELAQELGVPMFTASSAMQLFQAGKTKYPQGDNWIITQLLEEIVSTQVRR